MTTRQLDAGLVVIGPCVFAAFSYTWHMARQKHQLDWEGKQVRAWVLKNKGILTRIAIALQISPQFVQQVSCGKSTSLNHGTRLEVEKRLLQAGWPKIRSRNARISRTET